MMRHQPRTMERKLPERPDARAQYRRPYIWRVGLFVAVIVLVAIIVPVAVVLTRKKAAASPKTTAIIPLYIHPASSAWDPLYSALNSSTNLNFTIIVNPGSGPGAGDLPDDDYVSNIQKLNNYPNVRTIGYVPTTYGTRNISKVLADVATYSGWATKVSGLAVQGIFFDEVPHEYTSDLADYLSTIGGAVKSASGILREKTVIHNPGTVPDPGLSNNTDITVAFEETYDTYESQQSALSTLPLDRTHYSFILHSVPSSVNIGDLVNKMSQNAAYLFLTDLTDGYYENFSTNWSAFISALSS